MHAAAGALSLLLLSTCWNR